MKSFKSYLTIHNFSVPDIIQESGGGVQETTLNSTITELAPALAFMNKQKFTSVTKFDNWLQTLDHKIQPVYLNKRDAKSGEKYVQLFRTSSKFQDKMKNAIGVLKYLYDLDKQKRIKNVFWGYRTKPKGVNDNHKGDLFVEFATGSMIGISLKAGSTKSVEIQSNTYVNPIVKTLGLESELKLLQKDIWKTSYKPLGLPENWKDRSQYPNSQKILSELNKSDPDRYNHYYNIMLDKVRQFLIKGFNNNTEKTLNFIRRTIISKDEEVPLIVVKAVGKSYKFINDPDDLAAFLPFVDQVRAYSGRNKQEFYIDLSSGQKIITLRMNVRTNRPISRNKLAQGWNLSVQFKGLKS